MSRRLISTGSPFEKTAGYSRAVVDGDFAFVAGTTGYDYAATYYITDARDADAHFAVCGEVLGEIRPAATLLVVAGLYKPEMKIEIEVTAKRRTA
jgi:enamine deaminase RidA (YjgF/YER057c/UK114 family)